MTSLWRVLNGFEVALLIQYEFGPSSYSISLTDLTHIWTESLDRKRTIQKAFSLDTSIDPSEDASQMRLLLSSMQKALDQEPGTEMTFSSDDNGDHIAVSLTTPLPAALKPLKWNLALQRLPQSAVTMKVIVPLLSNELAANIERDSLLQHIREKDSVITKLISYMQTDGLDMSQIFPGSISSRPSKKTNLRQSMGTSIRGMAEFDEHAWRDRMKREAPVPLDTENILSRLSPITFTELTESFYMPEEVTWWQGMKQSKLSQLNKPLELSKVKMRENKDEISHGEANKSQRQSTPLETNQDKNHSLPQQCPIAQSPRSDLDSSTTDESDDLDSSRGKIAPLGAEIHVKNQGHAANSPTSDPNDAPAQSPNPHEDSIDLDAHTLSKGKSPAETKMSQSPDRPRLKSRLGKIGGKKRAEMTDHPQETELEVRPTSGRPYTENGVPYRIPQSTAATLPSPKTGSRGRTTTPARSASPPRETSEERANRNREQLKRQLDSKAQAGNKRKRKF